jgi:hypothetical protein
MYPKVNHQERRTTILPTEKIEEHRGRRKLIETEQMSATEQVQSI